MSYNKTQVWMCQNHAKPIAYGQIVPFFITLYTSHDYLIEQKIHSIHSPSHSQSHDCPMAIPWLSPRLRWVSIAMPLWCCPTCVSIGWTMFGETPSLGALWAASRGRFQVGATFGKYNYYTKWLSKVTMLNGKTHYFNGQCSIAMLVTTSGYITISSPYHHHIATIYYHH